MRVPSRESRCHASLYNFPKGIVHVHPTLPFHPHTVDVEGFAQSAPPTYLANPTASLARSLNLNHSASSFASIAQYLPSHNGRHDGRAKYSESVPLPRYRPQYQRHTASKNDPYLIPRGYGRCPPCSPQATALRPKQDVAVNLRAHGKYRLPGVLREHVGGSVPSAQDPVNTEIPWVVYAASRREHVSQQLCPSLGVWLLQPPFVCFPITVFREPGEEERSHMLPLVEWAVLCVGP